MKRLLILFLLFMNLAFVFSQKTTLKEYANKEGVTAVTISKNMLSLFPKNSNISYGGINVAEFLDKLTGINVFASQKEDVASRLVDDATQFMDTSGYDKLMSMKTEKEENINFYIQTNEEYISELVLIVQGESKESAVMQFMGKFTMEDIEQMIANAGK
ncbi:MAG: DUF4252 domain-containing protein [Bacteroidales bacterium]|nr:DUF4252 domain-containing protein [Bacteroidales bacterium]